jgi:hypothetical protein
MTRDNGTMINIFCPRLQSEPGKGEKEKARRKTNPKGFPSRKPGNALYSRDVAVIAKIFFFEWGWGSPLLKRKA